MNTLNLDLQDERFAALADCPAGETKTLTVTGTVGRAEDGSFTLAVENATEAEEAPKMAEEMPTKPMKPGKGGPDHPAVMVLVAKKPAKA